MSSSPYSQTRSAAAANLQNQLNSMQSAKKQDPQLQAAQAKVETVVDIMKANVNKMLDRDAKLTDLESKGEELRARSHTWKKVSTDLKTHHRCNSWLLSFLFFFMILIALGVALLALHPWDSTLFGTHKVHHKQH